MPGSDKLSVCKVNDGKGERTIVCGAQNYKAGDKVPLILPNFALPLKPGEKEPFVIKERQVFGIKPRHDVFAAGTRPAGQGGGPAHPAARTRRSANRSPNISAAPAATWFMTWKSRRTGRT